MWTRPSLVELAGQVIPALDPEMARSIELELLSIYPIEVYRGRG